MGFHNSTVFFRLQEVFCKKINFLTDFMKKYRKMGQTTEKFLKFQKLCDLFALGKQQAVLPLDGLKQHDAHHISGNTHGDRHTAQQHSAAVSAQNQNEKPVDTEYRYTHQRSRQHRPQEILHTCRQYPFFRYQQNRKIFRHR